MYRLYTLQVYVVVGGMALQEEVESSEPLGLGLNAILPSYYSSSELFTVGGYHES